MTARVAVNRAGLWHSGAASQIIRAAFVTPIASSALPDRERGSSSRSRRKCATVGALQSTAQLDRDSSLPYAAVEKDMKMSLRSCSTHWAPRPAAFTRAPRQLFRRRGLAPHSLVTLSVGMIDVGASDLQDLDKTKRAGVRTPPPSVLATVVPMVRPTSTTRPSGITARRTRKSEALG